MVVAPQRCLARGSYVVAAILLVLVLPACTGGGADEPSTSSTAQQDAPADDALPDWWVDRDPVPSCGVFEPEDVRFDNDELAAANRCLPDALAAGESAELELTQHTDEGEPVTDLLRVTGPDRVEWFVDRRFDSFGGLAVGHLVCTGLDEGELTVGAVDCEPTDERRIPPLVP